MGSETVIIGIDQSVNNPGICILDGDRLPWFIEVNLKKSDPTYEKIREIRVKLSQIFGCYVDDEERDVMVVFEGISFGGYNYRGKQSLYELLGVLKMLCYEWNVPFSEVPPQTLKKYFTGSGKATKEEMITLASKKVGKPLTSDEADAYALASYAKSRGVL